MIGTEQRDSSAPARTGDGGQAERRRKAPPLAQLGLGLSLLLLAAVVTEYTLYQRNSLYETEGWFPVKAGITNRPVEAIPYWLLGQTVARNRLDLSAWLGFNQVDYVDPLELSAVEFSVWLDQGAWASLVFEEIASGRGGGIRLSAEQRFPQIAFTADEAGRFGERWPLSETPLPPHRWVRIVVDLEQDGADVRIGKAPPVRVPLIWDGALRVGLRGGARSARIDDVALRLRSGDTIREDFRNGRHAVPLFAAFLVVLALLSYAVRPRRETPGRAMAVMIAFHLVVALCVGSLYAFEYFVRSHRYPRMEESIFGALEDALTRPKVPAPLRRHIQFVFEDLHLSTDPEQYGPDPEFFREKLRRRYPIQADPSVTRVLFIGTSQTHGDGVSVEDKTFVSLVEQRLNQLRGSDSKPIQCVNAGIANSVSEEMAAYYDEALVHMVPDLTVVNLGSNDAEEPMRFEEDMLRIAAASQGAGIPTLMTLEANAVECTDWKGLEVHDVTQRVASANGFGVVDLHGHIATNADEGFPWWDCVHFSPFGHQLAADLFVGHIAEALGLEVAEPLGSQVPEAVPRSGDTPSVVHCDETGSRGRCSEYTWDSTSLLGLDFYKGTCALTAGTWGEGTCRPVEWAGSCDDAAGMTVHHDAQSSESDLAKARKDCEAIGCRWTSN